MHLFSFTQQRVRFYKKIILLVAGFSIGTVFSFSSELLFTPDEVSIEKWAIAGFYRTSETEPELRVNSASSVQVPISGGGNTTVFSTANTDIELEQDAELVGFILRLKPKKLNYRVSVAQVRSFDLDYSSGPLVNNLSADNGLRVGFGVAGSIVPVTTASVGIAWSLDYHYLNVDLDRFESDGLVSKADQRFRQDELQAAVSFGTKVKEFVPYCGLKIQKVVSRLSDRGTRESIRGETEGISPVLGVEWTPFNGESAVIEASFVDEKSVTGSWIVKF